VAAKGDEVQRELDLPLLRLRCCANEGTPERQRKRQLLQQFHANLSVIAVVEPQGAESTAFT
jgi:hypothetical protein